MNRSDEILWISQVVLLNDKRAFGRLMQRYHCRVRRYFLMLTNGDRALSDDLAQTAFIRAWQGMNGFKMLSSFSTWLYRIAYNTTISALRRRPCNSVAIAEEILADTDDTLVDETLNNENEELLQRLDRAIALLSPEERALVRLYHLEERSISETAQITGLKENSVKVKLHRARKKLYILIKEQER